MENPFLSSCVHDRSFACFHTKITTSRGRVCVCVFDNRLVFISILCARGMGLGWLREFFTWFQHFIETFSSNLNRITRIQKHWRERGKTARPQPIVVTEIARRFARCFRFRFLGFLIFSLVVMCWVGQKQNRNIFLIRFFFCLYVLLVVFVVIVVAAVAATNAVVAAAAVVVTVFICSYEKQRIEFARTHTLTHDFFE